MDGSKILWLPATLGVFNLLQLLPSGVINLQSIGSGATCPLLSTVTRSPYLTTSSLDKRGPTCSQHDTRVPTHNQEGSQRILRSTVPNTLRLQPSGGLDVTTPLSFQRGQRRAKYIIDPMVEIAPRNPRLTLGLQGIHLLYDEYTQFVGPAKSEGLEGLTSSFLLHI
jgi:hypothetical protein